MKIIKSGFSHKYLLLLFITLVVYSCSKDNPSGPTIKPTVPQPILSHPDSVYIEWAGGYPDTILTYPNSNAAYVDSFNISNLSSVRVSFDSHVFNPYENNDSATLGYYLYYADSSRMLFHNFKYDGLSHSFNQNFDCNVYRYDSLGHLHLYYTPSGKFYFGVSVSKLNRLYSWAYPHRYFYVKNIALYRGELSYN